MSSGPESLLVRAILRALCRIPHVRAVKQHGSRYGIVGTPDLLVCARGHMLMLEVKTPTGRVSPAQEAQLALWRNAGATTGVVRSVAEAEALVRAALGAEHEPKGAA